MIIQLELSPGAYTKLINCSPGITLGSFMELPEVAEQLRNRTAGVKFDITVMGRVVNLQSDANLVLQPLSEVNISNSVKGAEDSI